MKKIISMALAALLLSVSAYADEGMWLLPLLQKMNGKAMAELGCRLTPEQIYSVNNSSIKDAIVQFGGGCTGEIISDEGLLVTNHHCGYGSIQSLSTPEHNYLEDGFWAMNRSEEMPVPGLTVKFLQRMDDVTKVLEKARKDASKKQSDPAEVEKAVEKAAGDLAAKAREATDLEINIAVGPYPILLMSLAEEFGLEKAEEMMVQGMEDAGKAVQEGKAVAIGEIGRPHFECSPEIWDASNRVL